MGSLSEVGSGRQAARKVTFEVLSSGSGRLPGPASGVPPVPQVRVLQFRKLVVAFVR